MNESSHVDDTLLAVESNGKRSKSLGKFAEALAKAQGQITGAAKDAINPFFKSRYADLASIMDACRKPLSENGIAIIQRARTTENGIEVETILIHSSGEEISETLALPVSKFDAQGIGSAITYARRYGLSALVGVCPDDDDGNAATAAAQRRMQSTPDAKSSSAPVGPPPESRRELSSADKIAWFRDNIPLAIKLEWLVKYYSRICDESSFTDDEKASLYEALDQRKREIEAATPKKDVEAAAVMALPPSGASDPIPF